MHIESWKLDDVTYLLCRGYGEYAIWWAGCRCTPWVSELDEIVEGELLQQCYDAIEQIDNDGHFEYKKVELARCDTMLGDTVELYLGLE